MVSEELLLTETQNLEGLFLSNETALNPESLVSDLFATFVRVFFEVVILTFFCQKPLHSEQSFISGEGTNHGRILI
jgi:hypothetical protein